MHVGWRSYGPAQHASGSTPLTAVSDQITRAIACLAYNALAAPGAAQPKVHASHDSVEQSAGPVCSSA